MRIPRPKPREATFKRRRSPPPQATRLLRWSTIIVIVFAGLLAVVFVPRGLIAIPCSSIVDLSIEPGSRLLVTSATRACTVGDYYATLSRDGREMGSLDPGLSGGNATLSFVDDGDRQLGAGDVFFVDASIGGVYRFEIRLVHEARLVGLKEWTGALS